MRRNEKKRINTIEDLQRAYNFDNISKEIEKLKGIEIPDISGKLDISKIGVELWSGSWNSGSIIVPDIDNYKVLLIMITAEIGLFGYNFGTFIRAGVVDNQSNAISTYALILNKNGNTLTFYSANGITHNSAGNHGTQVSSTVRRIIGLI